RRDAADGSSRPKTPRGRDRLLQRATHLESETAASPACPLRGSGRRIGARPYAVDRGATRVLSAGARPQPGVSGEVRGRFAGTARVRQTDLSWRLGAADRAGCVRGHAAATVPFRLGRVCQASLRRGGARATLSGRLHAPGGDLQSPSGGAGKRRGGVP